jgi:NAD(P)-dependent dehydrogenase (short-subunit alcohol dehydrogenase family)
VAGHGPGSLARIRQARGDQAGALEAIGEAEHLVPNPETIVDIIFPVAVQRARLLLALGRMDDAARWCAERGLGVEDEPSYLREREHLVLARVLLAQDKPEQALRLLERHAVAKDIEAAGGSADVAVLDALDEEAVEEHAWAVVSQAGSIDVSFNLITRGDVQGIPLVEMKTDDLLRAVVGGLRTNFVTARAAARHMFEQGSGVILALDSGSANGSPMMGSTGPADAATDIFIRNLAAEVGPQGVRVVGIWTAGLPETFSREKLAAVDSNLALDDAAYQGLLDGLDQMRMTRRSPRLAEVAATAAFLASEKAGAITGTFVNATSGMFPS